MKRIVKLIFLQNCCTFVVQIVKLDRFNVGPCRVISHTHASHCLSVMCELEIEMLFHDCLLELVENESETEQ